jgi:PleD family two-component response regulator
MAARRALRSVTPGSETCSAGVAQWDVGETPQELVRRADAALYGAKRTGRDRSMTARPIPGT